MKNFLKKHNKLITIVVLAILIATFVIIKVVKAKTKNTEPEYEIAKIERRTLTNTISCSGTLKTEESKNVTSLLVGSKITGVNVKVGDVVNAGDVLITFDVETLNKTANDLASSINAAKQQSNITVATAERAVQDAENAKNNGLDTAKSAKDQAQSAYDAATSAFNSTNDQINSLQSQISSLGNISAQYKNAQADVATKQSAYNQAETEYNNAVSAGTVGGDLTNLEAAKNNANNELQTSKINLTNLEASYQKYTALTGQIAQLSSKLPELKVAVDQTKSAYESAERAYNNANSNLDSAILNAKDTVTTSKIGSSTATLSLEEQLMATKKQLEDANLKSTVSGTVTAVSAKKGDTYQGGTLVTIEGTESFIIEANVDEYDISDIQEGMDVIIKTDATRDEELQGKVIFVAPTSNESSSSNAMAGTATSMGAVASSAASSATYLVKIEVLTPNDRLKLGMSAKASIIAEKAENTLSVPYDAITEKENGKKVITVINDDETQKEIEVEVGLESGYYSEIKSDKIKEGMKIVLPKLEGNSTLDDLLDTMGATGGIE